MARLATAPTRSRRAITALAVAALVATLAPGIHARGEPSSEGTFRVHVTVGEGPSERSTPAVATVDEDIYLFGGVRDDFRTNVNVFYDDLYRFEPSANPDRVPDRWTELDPDGVTPPPRAFAASVGDDARGRMYVFGGAFYGPGFVGFVAYDDLWAYDVADDEWTMLDPHALGGGPTGRSRPNMWLVGDDLYVFGGVTATFETLNDLWRYDLDTGEWTELIPNGAQGSPPTRHEAFAGTAAHDGRLTVYGGEIVELPETFFELLDDTWELDLATGQWEDVTPTADGDALPAPERNYGAGGIVGDHLYLYGGDLPGGSSDCGAPFAQNPTDELWRFDLDQRTWEPVTPGGDPTVPLKRTNAAVARDRVYVFGGYDWECDQLTDPGQVWNPHVYSYEPDEPPPSRSGGQS